MDKDFWDKAFGGKDMLRLSLGAYNFCTSKTEITVTYSFDCGVEKSVRVMTLSKDPVLWYTIWCSDGVSKRSDTVCGLSCARICIEQFTGLSLDPFNRG